MKRETALRIAEEIAAKLQACNGIVDTPTAGRPQVLVSELWMFGSTVKGAERPNDLDLLWDVKAIGEYRDPGKDGAELDREHARRYGYWLSKDPFTEARRVLVGGRKMVRLHFKGIDGYLAYPRMLLFQMEGCTPEAA